MDGHLKSVPYESANTELHNFYRCVRGTEEAFENSLTNNGDGTVSDSATGLMWEQANATETIGDYQFTWEAALSYCEASTTDENDPIYANYVCFGPCWDYTLATDIHGPGAQRSEPKYDNDDLPASLGDQNDLVQANNYVRCVR